MSRQHLRTGPKRTRRKIMTAPAHRVNWVEISDPTVQNGPTPSSSSQGRIDTPATGESAIDKRGSPLAPTNQLDTPPPAPSGRVRVVRTFTTTQASSDPNSTLSTKRKRVEIETQDTAASSGASTPTPEHPTAHSSQQQYDDDDGLPAWDDTPGPAGDSTANDKEPAAKRAKQTGRIDVMELFADKRDIIAREWARHDGMKTLPVSSKGYARCAGVVDGARCPEEGSLRCTECWINEVWCAECICKEHAANPLHTIEIWNGRFASPYSLQRAGLVVQLGHDDGTECERPGEEFSMTVIDITGIHNVQCALCDCTVNEFQEPLVQSMRARWWPATMRNPRTVTTFRLLKFFRAIHIQGHNNGYDFYNGIVRISDGSGLGDVKMSYREFLRCTRMYRHIRQLKQAGRAHDPAGVAGTAEGELALVCPACPNEDNLPPNWRDAPEEEQFLYQLDIAIDANFKLKLKDRVAKSVQLADGWSFFVPSIPYFEHLTTNTDMYEMKHCASEHNALRHANMATSKRWIVNGVGAAICARHLLYRPNGVVDLPRGERFACMDYCVFKMLGKTAHHLKRLLLSYDISCSWSVGFYERLEELYGNLFDLDPDMEIVFVVPKFHLGAHGDDCKGRFNLNFTCGAGRTCGEGVEAGWADMNAIGVFTREQSAAHRREVIEDFMQAINFRKIRTMGPYMLGQLKEAIPMAAKHTSRYESYEKTYPPAIIADWKLRVAAWESVKNKKRADCPYLEPVRTQSTAAVKKKLADEETAELARGIALNEMTASTYISTVMALQDQKYLLDLKAKKKYLSEHDEESLQIKYNQLLHRMQTLASVQACYIRSEGISTAVKDEIAKHSLLSKAVDADTTSATGDTPKGAKTKSSSRGAPGKRLAVDDGDTDFVEIAMYAPPPPPLAFQSFTPKIAKKRGRAKPSAGEGPPTLPSLWLASNIPSSMHNALCLGGLVDKELQLNLAVLDDTVDNVKRSLRTRHAFYLTLVKDGHASQKKSTRNQTTLKGINDTLKRHAARYNRAFKAMCALDPLRRYEGGKWAKMFHPLEASDLRPPSEDTRQSDLEDTDDDSDAEPLTTWEVRVAAARRKKKQREGDKEVSWIWMVGSAGVEGVTVVDGLKDVKAADAYDYLRVEWGRMRGRSKRWSEQERRLVEEMRRVAVSHSKTAQKWVQRAEEVSTWMNADSLPTWAGEFVPKGVVPDGGEGSTATASTSANAHQATSSRSLLQSTPSKQTYGIDIIRGLRAYAYRQSHTWHMLGVACVRLWAPLLDKHDKDVEWPESMRAEAAAAVVRWKEEEAKRAAKKAQAGTAKAARKQNTELAAVAEEMDGDEVTGVDDIDNGLDEDTELDALGWFTDAEDIGAEGAA